MVDSILQRIAENPEEKDQIIEDSIVNFLQYAQDLRRIYNASLDDFDSKARSVTVSFGISQIMHPRTFVIKYPSAGPGGPSHEVTRYIDRFLERVYGKWKKGLSKTEIKKKADREELINILEEELRDEADRVRKALKNTYRFVHFDNEGRRTRVYVMDAVGGSFYFHILNDDPVISPEYTELKPFLNRYIDLLNLLKEAKAVT